jgi:Zn-dependent protease with chaperone function
MMVSYGLRLACLCLATFFLVNACLSLLVSAGARAAVGIAKRMRARSAARFLLLLRLLPPTAALAAVLALCVPSYLWLEPESVPERVSWVCFFFVFLAMVQTCGALSRGIRALRISLRFHERWTRSGRPARLAGNDLQAVVVEREAPLLALAGIFRPQLFVSESVLHALSAEQLELALRHEQAHHSSRDNWKRLLLLLAPAAVPFLPGIFRLEREWVKLSEWAADDDAAQGDAKRALSLASALVRVARLGAGPQLPALHSSLVGGEHELAARVDRLLHIGSRLEKPLPKGKYLAAVVAGALAVCSLLTASAPAALSSTHRLLELVVR